MEWNAENYRKTCNAVTERGTELVDIIKEMKCYRVLDLGCGTGVLTNEISKFANKVIGIDSSHNMIEQAKKLYPNVEFVLMDACSLKWKNHFDMIFSNAVFHFIQSQDILLNSIYMALEQNGILFCEFGAFGNIKDLLNTIEKVCEKRKKKYSLRFFYPEKDNYEKLLNEHGFHVESITVFDLDSLLNDGKFGLKNWINLVFQVEMNWFDIEERDEVITEIENSLRDTYWD